MRDFTQEDRAMRAKLERNSSAGMRANVAGMINALAKAHDARAMPGLSAYGVVRLLQGDNRAAQAREAQRHNRSHDDYLARRVAAERLNIAEEDDARDARYVTQLEANQAPGADGAMHADARTRRDKWDRQGVHLVEPDWLTVEQLRVIAGVKALQSRYW